MHSTSNAGGKTGRGRGWKLDYLKFRGNYEGNYRENLFLDPIVHRGERSTIRSSRKTSATREIGALAPVRFFVRSPRWNPCDGLAPNSFRTTWLRSPPVPYVIATLSDSFCGYRLQEKLFYYLRGFILRGVLLFARSCFRIERI